MCKSRMYLASILACITLSSCSTIFTGTRQSITFTGEPGTKIYKNGNKITEIAQEGTSTVKVKKSLSSTNLIAKKDGYKNTPVALEATFNPVSIINVFNVIGWAVDLGTGAACKFDNTVVEVELKKDTAQN